VIGPLITASGPLGTGRRRPGVTRRVSVAVAGDDDVDVELPDEEHPASAMTATTATLRMTYLLRSIGGVSRVYGGPGMDEREMRRRVDGARVARLATVGPDGRPHLVPCCFSLVGGVVYSAVDAKPKSTIALRRLANLRANPHASMLVDHYSDDWSTLWWVRIDGEGRVLDDGPERADAIAVLTHKYPIYAVEPPPGAVVAIDVTAWRAWP
jgi:PPOX class probable F420-dependent enzyme